MREDVLEVLFGELSRVQFMNKYGLQKRTTVDYIVNARREFGYLNIHLDYIGGCNLNLIKET